MNNHARPAFPWTHADTWASDVSEDDLGLTKREYFAAFIMAQLVLRGEVDASYADHYANAAVQHADALVAALKRLPPPAESAKGGGA